MNLKRSLRGIIPESKLEFVRSSFDTVGDIAVLEIPRELKKYEKKIAKKVAENHKYIKIVAKKAGVTKGKKRIRKIKIILGEKRTHTIHKENGIRLKVDINKVFFTPRLANERLRILNMVKKGEIVADLFAGVGPYAILIAKKSNCKKVIANDINKSAVKLLKENAKLNKVEDKMEIHSTDARKIKLKADRFIMNVPLFIDDFLDLSFKTVKKGVVHFYYFKGRETENKREKIKNLAKKAKKKIRILREIECGDYGPGITRNCIDFKIYGS